MRDADTLETINREQLATATDRLLLGGGRMAKRRRSALLAPRTRGSIPSIARAPVVRGSPWIAPSAPRPLDPRQERTVPARRRARNAQRSGSAVALAVRF